MVSAPSWRTFTGGSDGLSGFAKDFRDANPIPDGSYGFGACEYNARDLGSCSSGGRWAWPRS